MVTNSIKPAIGIETLGTKDLLDPKTMDKSQGADFQKALKDSVEKTKNIKEPGIANNIAKFKFSNHAVERMRTRGIHYSPDQMLAIGEAMAKAQDKGAKETLIIAENSAMIVNNKNNTVVTVMDKNQLKENVFTNIDSTILI